MVIDAHAHLVANPKHLDRVVGCGVFEQIWIMDICKCDPTTASAETIIKLSKDYPGFFIPFGYLDFREGPEIVDVLKEKGFVGLKAIKPPRPYDDASCFPYYAKAEKYGMPVLFHTGIVYKGKREDVEKGFSFGPTNMRPSMLDSIAEAFPGLTIIGGHLGYPWLEETAESLYFYPNIYHDLSGYRKSIDWLLRNLDRKCHDGCPEKKYFNDKIMFATDAFYGTQEANEGAFKLAEFWGYLLEYTGGYYYRWGEPEERAKIMGANASKIMGKILNGGNDKKR